MNSIDIVIKFHPDLYRDKSLGDDIKNEIKRIEKVKSLLTDHGLLNGDADNEIAGALITVSDEAKQRILDFFDQLELCDLDFSIVDKSEEEKVN